MGCETGVKPRKPIEAAKNVNSDPQKEAETMSSTMVRREMPKFIMDAYDAKTGHFTSVSSDDYKGKWSVVCFYPADFTFVCPTEIAAMSAKYDEFQKLGVEILAVSVDSKFSHKRFVETEPLLKDLKLTIGADSNQEVSRELGIHIPEDVALIGEDDIPLASLVTPALSTLSVDKGKMGALAMQSLLACIRGEGDCSEPVILEPRLILRASA